jgi:hypothetical protein
MSFSKDGKEGKIVLSGMAGCFPLCDSVIELEDKLFAKVDVVTEDYRRWEKSRKHFSAKTKTDWVMLSIFFQLYINGGHTKLDKFRR